MKMMIRVLVAAFIFLPQMVKGQQLQGSGKTQVVDTVKQNIQQPAATLKPTLGKYDYYNSLGAACKAEIKLEKATKIPFRFRLGSLQQTDYLEGKPNVQKPENR